MWLKSLGKVLRDYDNSVNHGTEGLIFQSYKRFKYFYLEYYKLN